MRLHFHNVISYFGLYYKSPVIHFPHEQLYLQCVSLNFYPILKCKLLGYITLRTSYTIFHMLAWSIVVLFLGIIFFLFSRLLALSLWNFILTCLRTHNYCLIVSVFNGLFTNIGRIHCLHVSLKPGVLSPDLLSVHTLPRATRNVPEVSPLK